MYAVGRATDSKAMIELAFMSNRFTPRIIVKANIQASRSRFAGTATLWGPCEPPSSAAAPGAVGGFMFERVAAQRIARVRIRRPARRATQGSRPTGDRRTGVPFFLVTLFLGKQEKVAALPGHGRPQNKPREAPLQTEFHTNHIHSLGFGCCRLEAGATGRPVLK